MVSFTGIRGINAVATVVETTHSRYVTLHIEPPPPPPPPRVFADWLALHSRCSVSLDFVLDLGAFDPLRADPQLLEMKRQALDSASAPGEGSNTVRPAHLDARVTTETVELHGEVEGEVFERWLGDLLWEHKYTFEQDVAAAGAASVGRESTLKPQPHTADCRVAPRKWKSCASRACWQSAASRNAMLCRLCTKCLTRYTAATPRVTPTVAGTCDTWWSPTVQDASKPWAADEQRFCRVVAIGEWARQLLPLRGC